MHCKKSVRHHVSSTADNLIFVFFYNMLFVWLAVSIQVLITPNAYAQEPSHGVAMHGAVNLPADFQHFSYVNPNAAKGGTLKYGVMGSFDSLNPFIIKGAAGRGIWDFQAGRNVFESLLHRNRDEPFSLYALIAEKVVMDDARSFIEFHINPKARFSDGSPVTAEDVAFSIELLGTHGKPNYRNRWKKIKSTQVTGNSVVRFVFTEEADRELPLLIALMPILSKAATDVATFKKSSLKPLMGSGPYKVSDVKPGSSITLTLRDDYWARDLPSKRGFDNFKTLHFEYFRDQNILNDAFKKGLFDFVTVGNPKNWANGFDFPAVHEGKIVKYEIPITTPAAMQGFVFNTRKKNLSNPKIREALTLLFDFEWINRNLFGGAYTRTESFWQGSSLSALAKPANDTELALLKPFVEGLREPIIDGTFYLSKTDGSGSDRTVLRKAFALFKEAGYTIKDKKLVDAKDNQFSIEVLISNSKLHERLALAWQQNVRKLGIDMQIRVADHAQLQRRKNNYEFDITPMVYYASLSPGAEQTGRWGSISRDRVGTFNLAGANDPALDAMIEALVQAKDRAGFESAVRAFDRVLMNGYYILPFYHLDKTLLAMRANIQMPKKQPLYGIQPPTWWDNTALKE